MRVNDNNFALTALKLRPAGSIFFEIFNYFSGHCVLINFELCLIAKNVNIDYTNLFKCTYIN